ncbi:hypothetical protein B9G55_00705 [Saccharibacillus sp. O16]|nr:hypothetical protein B9G55_00705 [Saccharibacillus sp. O16]
MLKVQNQDSHPTSVDKLRSDRPVGQPMLMLDQVSRRYGTRTVLHNLSFSLHKGQSLILRGGNGSGKSTLLKLVAGMIPTSSGTVRRNGRHLRIGFAPDRLPKLRLTSEEYLTHMGRIAGMNKVNLSRRIEELHDLLELPAGSSSLMLHYSKGMLQKVNLMQAVLNEPSLLLLDEPFSGLDTASSNQLLSLLHGMRAQGTAIMTALHDPLPSWEAVSTTYRLQEGQLRLEEGPAEGHLASASYELDGLLPDVEQAALAAKFPSVQWSAAENVVRCEIPGAEYEDFVQHFWRAGGTLLSLRREEGRS